MKHIHHIPTLFAGLFLCLLASVLTACGRTSRTTGNQTNGGDTIVDEADGEEQGDILPYFSVSDSTSVYFAPANLQYHPATHTWRYAAHSYEHPEANSSEWIDLFGWSTTDMPYGVNCATTYAGEFADWGDIAPADEFDSEWRTLTKDEWTYLFGRDSVLWSAATIAGTEGIILLPDLFTKTDSFAWQPAADNYHTNVYSATEWQPLEEAGAVFLPATSPGSDDNKTSVCGYWSSTSASEEEAYALYYDGTLHPAQRLAIRTGCAVRLVREL